MKTQQIDKSDLDSINNEQKLYVINCGHGYTCLGFDVCERWAGALAKEMSMASLRSPTLRKGTREHYENYRLLVNEARKRNEQTGWRSESQLTPQLNGLEGKRVEVVDAHGDKRRFYVGKSTGWIPCHLEIARSNSSGGSAVTGAPFKSVRVLGKSRY